MCGPYLILKPKAPISTPIQTKITISPPPPPYTTAIFSTTAFLLLQQSSRRGNLYNIQACTLMATTSISATGFSSSSSSFRGSWKSSICGEDGAPNMLNKCSPNMVRVGKPMRLRIVMGNVNEGKGIFAPAVVVARNIIGKKRFNQLRGKAIALHSQVITEFCKSIGADAKQRQGLIRLAKKNGEKLGFLA